MKNGALMRLLQTAFCSVRSSAAGGAFSRIFYLILSLSLWSAVAFAEEPWSIQDSAPVVETGGTALSHSMRVRPAVPDGFVKTGCYVWLMAYQKGFSRFSASKCPLKPSCSNYSLEAIAQYGGFWGVLMTVDRLFHEGSVRHTAPWMQDVDRIRYLDPVNDNVIWRTVP
jgi:putative component of membrane protein insertase Oxa1/YidC/SpoIIIJ protein YidD